MKNLNAATNNDGNTQNKDKIIINILMRIKHITKILSNIFIYILKKIKDFFKISDKFENNLLEKNFSLLPMDEVDEDNSYYNKFRTAVNNNCKSIAFEGRYGIGKTSIINSILNKYRKRSIRISLGDYSNDEYTKTTADGQNSHYDNIINALELKILQQILYTTNQSKLPKSRFNRISEVSPIIVLKYIFLLLFILCLLFPLLSNYYIKIFYLFFDFIKYSSFNNIALRNIISAIFVISLILFLYNVTKLIICAFSSLQIKYKGIEIKLDKNKDISVFDKYMDEIVYFFSKTKTNILVIEDLDRYQNVSLPVFNELKELNYLLNTNKQIKDNGGVIFIYAIKDDMFVKPENRVKFFDKIITIVPKFSYFNSKQYLMQMYNDIKSTAKYSKIDIKDGLFSLISYSINDMRILKNIFSDFLMYIDIYGINQNINYTQLFALISYKNINPIDFEKSNNFEGDLYNFFDFKENFTNILSDKYYKEIESKDQKIIEYNKYKYKTQSNIKSEFLLQELKKYNTVFSLNNLVIAIGNLTYNIDQFLSLDIVDEMYVKNWYIKTQYNNYTIHSNSINQLKDELSNLSVNIILLENQKSELQEKVNTIKNLNMEKLLNVKDFKSIILNYLSNEDRLIFNDDNALQNVKNLLNNKYLYSLILCGYITENYRDSLNYFIPSDIQQSEYNFITDVEVGNETDNSFEIKNVSKVVDKIDLEKFSSPSVLNYSLCKYLLVNNNNDSKKEKFESQFSDLTERKVEFLSGLFKHDSDLFVLLIKDILNDNVIETIVNNPDLFNNMVLLKIISSVSIKQLNENNMSIFKDLLSDANNLNKLNFTEICKANLDIIKPLIKEYNALNTNIIEYLYSDEQQNFEPNESFYLKLLEIYNIPIKSNFIDIIEGDTRFSKFKSKMFESHTFDSLYSSITNYNSSISNIISFINSSHIDSKTIELLANNEKSKISELCEIENKDIWSAIINSDFCVLNMKNLLDYYSYSNNIDMSINKILENIKYNNKHINDPRLEQFEIDLLYSNYSNQSVIDNVSKNFSTLIKSFEPDKTLNEKLLNNLILSKKVELNTNTFDYLKKSNTDLLIQLIKLHIDDFVITINDYNIDIYIINKLLKESITIDSKYILLNNLNSNYLSLIDSNTYSSLLSEFIKKQLVFNKEVNDNIFSKVEDEKMLTQYYLNLIASDISNVGYLYNINSKYKDIRDGWHNRFTIDFTEYRESLFKYLCQKNVINNVYTSNKKNVKTLNISYKIAKLN